MTSKALRKQRRREEHQARKKANRTGQLPPAVGGEQPNAQPELETPPFPQSLRTARSGAASFTNPAWSNLDAFPPELDAYVKSVGDRMTLKDDATAETRPAAKTATAIPTQRTARNRQNAQHSTGPKTPEGKAQSSQNAFRHGLASNRFMVFDWEKVEDFHALLTNLRAEHQPSTQTEALLVEKMAEHFWLSQRALLLQDMCFHPELPHCQAPNDLALYIRYGTTHDRAFHKCIDQLAKLRAEKRKEASGFVSQQRQQAAETREQELHEARIAVLASKKYTAKEKQKSKASPADLSTASSTAKQPNETPFVSLEDRETSAWLTGTNFSQAA